jgi:hypothetical protein
MRGKWILAAAVTLVYAVDARASFQTTQVTLVAPFGGAANVTAMVNKTGGEGTGQSYTVTQGNTGAAGTPIFDTGAILLGTYKLFNGTSNSFTSTVSLVESFAVQGHTIAPNAGSTFSVTFTAGVFAINTVASGTFNQTDTTTWGTSNTPLYSAVLTTGNTVKGPMGDQSFTGQPATGQNEANFVAASGVSSVGAVIVKTLSNPGTLFAPPQPFDGFQAELKELNALTNAPGNYPANVFIHGPRLPSRSLIASPAA